jgi:hypothetical protein
MTQHDITHSCLCLLPQILFKPKGKVVHWQPEQPVAGEPLSVAAARCGLISVPGPPSLACAAAPPPLLPPANPLVARANCPLSSAACAGVLDTFTIASIMVPRVVLMPAASDRPRDLQVPSGHSAYSLAASCNQSSVIISHAHHQPLQGRCSPASAHVTIRPHSPPPSSPRHHLLYIMPCCPT